MQSYISLKPIICFKTLFKFMHTNRYPDAKDMIFAFYTCSYDLLYPKHHADLNRINTIFGVKYGYFHVLGIPPLYFFANQACDCIFLIPWWAPWRSSRVPSNSSGGYVLSLPLKGYHPQWKLIPGISEVLGNLQDMF